MMSSQQHLSVKRPHNILASLIPLLPLQVIRGAMTLLSVTLRVAVFSSTAMEKTLVIVAAVQGNYMINAFAMAKLPSPQQVINNGKEGDNINIHVPF